jgi:hypothetical protein
MHRLRLLTWLFVLSQSVGVACIWSAKHVPSTLGVPMWAVTLIVLFPGNVLASWVVESVFWRSGLSTVAMGVMESGLLVIINGTIWLAMAKICCWLLRRAGKRDKRGDIDAGT